MCMEQTNTTALLLLQSYSIRSSSSWIEERIWFEFFWMHGIFHVAISEEPCAWTSQDRNKTSLPAHCCFWILFFSFTCIQNCIKTSGALTNAWTPAAYKSCCCCQILFLQEQQRLLEGSIHVQRSDKVPCCPLLAHFCTPPAAFPTPRNFCVCVSHLIRVWAQLIHLFARWC